MVCRIEIFEKPKLNKPVLIEGLPGIGFVANIAALHLIRELKATRFAEIHSSAFQDLTVTTETGATRSPLNELYYYQRPKNGDDLIIWYGNTQALTTFGQYELCEHVLGLAKELDCRCAITLGGFRQNEVQPVPQIYAAASDLETLNQALGLGAKTMVGQVYGVAGLLVGLGKLKGIRAFTLLVETLGTYPDAAGAKRTLSAVGKFLNLDVDMTNVDAVAEETKKILESFGLLRGMEQEKKKEEQPFRWFI